VRRESRHRTARNCHLRGIAVIVIVLRSLRVSAASLLHTVPFRLHCIAIGVSAIVVGARVARTRVIANACGARLRFGTALQAALAGEAAGAVTPARSGSDPAKLLLWRRDGMRVGTGAAVLLGEITAEAVSVTLVSAVLVIGFDAPLLAAGAALAYAGWVAVTTTVATTIAYALVRGRHNFVSKWLARRVPRIRRTAFGYLASIRRLRSLPPGAHASTIALSVVHIAARLSLLPALALQAAPTGSMTELLAWPLVLLYASALVPLPSGGGTVEISFLLLLRGVLPAAQLAVLLFWWRFYSYFLLTLCGGLVLLRHGYRPTDTTIAQARAATRRRAGTYAAFTCGPVRPRSRCNARSFGPQGRCSRTPARAHARSAQELADQGVNLAFLSMNWGFPPEQERSHWRAFAEARRVYNQCGISVIGYVQASTVWRRAAMRRTPGTHAIPQAGASPTSRSDS
jgi:uncharacterized membrane protein YbhN (UPF0104 family)